MNSPPGHVLLLSEFFLLFIRILYIGTGGGGGGGATWWPVEATASPHPKDVGQFDKTPHTSMLMFVFVLYFYSYF